MADYLDSTTGPDEGDETYDVGAQSEGGFDFVEFAAEGWYEVICTSAVFGKAKSSGNSQWTLTLGSPDVPTANAKYYLTNSPGAFWRVEKDLKTFGLEPPVKGGPTVTYRSEDFVGKKVEALAKHETWNGRKTFKFTELRPTAEGPGARAYAG